MVNKINKSACLLALGVAMTVGTPVFADGVEDFYHQFNQQRFFNYPQSARTLGMGSASSVTSVGAYSTMGNAAGLGMMKDAEATIGYAYDQLTGKDIDGYGDIEQEAHSGYALAALPIMPHSDGLPAWGNIGFGWSGYSSDIDDTDNTDTMGRRLHVAYSKAITDNFSLGYGIGLFVDEVESDSAGDYEMDDGLRHSLGAMVKASEQTSLGFNAFWGDGTGETGDLDIDRESWGVEAGLAQAISDATTLAFSSDYVSYDSDPGIDTKAWGFKTGVEHMFNEKLTGRAGYRYQSNFSGGFGESAGETAKYNAVSLGVGTSIGMVNLDYGTEYRAIGDGDWSHLVSATVPFSICK